MLYVCSSKHFFLKNCRSLSISNDILYCIVIKVNEYTLDEKWLSRMHSWVCPTETHWQIFFSFFLSCLSYRIKYLLMPKLFLYIFLSWICCFFLNVGTPCQETWPGISSSDEFRNYNFPKYKPQPLINHAPRYFVFY